MNHMQQTCSIPCTFPLHPPFCNGARTIRSDCVSMVQEEAVAQQEQLQELQDQHCKLAQEKADLEAATARLRNEADGLKQQARHLGHCLHALVSATGFTLHVSLAGGYGQVASHSHSKAQLTTGKQLPHGITRQAFIIVVCS